jgi:hypothetical protein
MPLVYHAGPELEEEVKEGLLEFKETETEVCGSLGFWSCFEV